MYDQQLAGIYDLIYTASGIKDYAAEAADLAALIRVHNPGARSVLDVACGTGEHLRYLSEHFDDVAGVELSEPMRRIAQTKVAHAALHPGDMREFALGRTFDAVLCLFSSIGYVRSDDELRQAITAMLAHLEPGGLLVVEPWFEPAQWQDNRIGHVVAVGDDGRRVVRMAHSLRDGRTSRMFMHYLVGDPAAGGGDAAIRYFSDIHEMTLFTTQEYTDTIHAAGYRSVELVDGWTEGRPRIVAVKA